MDAGQIPDAVPPGPEDVADQMSDAVRELVALWSGAVQQAAPRLSALQLHALEALERGSRLNLTGLAAELEIGLPTASRLCDRLEAAGLLERAVRPRNRREVLLAVTARGRELLDHVADRRRRALGRVVAEMAPAERAALVSALRAFHTASGAIPPRDRPADRPG